MNLLEISNEFGRKGLDPLTLSCASRTIRNIVHAHFEPVWWRPFLERKARNAALEIEKTYPEEIHIEVHFDRPKASHALLRRICLDPSPELHDDHAKTRYLGEKTEATEP